MNPCFLRLRSTEGPSSPEREATGSRFRLLMTGIRRSLLASQDRQCHHWAHGCASAMVISSLAKVSIRIASVPPAATLPTCSLPTWSSRKARTWFWPRQGKSTAIGNWRKASLAPKETTHLRPDWHHHFRTMLLINDSTIWSLLLGDLGKDWERMHSCNTPFCKKKTFRVYV